jgi:hypothetical protein
MRIVKREEFLKQPTGTLFSKYMPCAFSDLCIKGDTSTLSIDDFWFTTVPWPDGASDSEVFNTLEKAKNDSEFSFDLDFESCDRDGLFDQGQLFAIWEEKDLNAFIGTLQHCYGTLFRDKEDE